MAATCPSGAGRPLPLRAPTGSLPTSDPQQRRSPRQSTPYRVRPQRSAGPAGPVQVGQLAAFGGGGAKCSWRGHLSPSIARRASRTLRCPSSPSGTTLLPPATRAGAKEERGLLGGALGTKAGDSCPGQACSQAPHQPCCWASGGKPWRPGPSGASYSAIPSLERARLQSLPPPLVPAQLELQLLHSDLL